EAFDQAARRARALDDKPAFVLAALSFAEASPPSGAPDPTVIALLEEALVALGDEDGWYRALALAMLGQALYFSDLERSQAASVQALGGGRRGGARRGPRGRAPGGGSGGSVPDAPVSPGGALRTGGCARAARPGRRSRRRRQGRRFRTGT